MNEFEKLLWNQLEDYKENGNTDMFPTPQGNFLLPNKEIWEYTKEAEYVYKCFPMWGGALNSEGKRENIHALIPKEDFEAWDINKIAEKDGTPLIASIDKKDRMYFATKEVIE